MAFPISRALARSLKGRFYSVQAASKVERPAPEPLTSVKVNGINVVTTDTNAPVSRIVFAIDAGSRHENYYNQGITHTIRHLTHLTNRTHSTFAFIKESERMGCSINATTGRDYAYLTINCTRDLVEEVFQLVEPSLTRDRFDSYNWRDYENEIRDNVGHDVDWLHGRPDIQLMEGLHSVAYRNVLGNPTFCPPAFIGQHKVLEILMFFNAYYRPERTGIAASGVDTNVLTDLAKTMKYDKDVIEANDWQSVYWGGESRLPRPGLKDTFVAVATEGPGMASKDVLTAALLQQIMGLGPRIKYSDSTVGSKLNRAVKKVTDKPVLINGLNVNHSDSGLFGFTVAASQGEIEKVLRTTFDEFRTLTKTGVTDEEVVRGKNQLKASIAMEMESANAVVANLARQAVGSESFTTVDDVLKMVDAIKTADVNAVAKKLVNGKPSMASVGYLDDVPFLEDLLK